MPSLRHRFLARVIPRVRRSSDVEDPEEVRREKLTEHAKADTRPPPRVVAGCTVSTVEGLGFPVHDLRIAGSFPQRTVVYLHGGGYISHADAAHWRFAVRLAGQLGARVVFPVYPLAPESTWRDSREQMLALFDQVAIESPQGVTLAGDSAGGGFALALAQQLAARSGPQPTHVVLLSPWADVTCASPGTAEASARDPWLNMSRLLLAGQWWAGGDDPTRPEVSPLYGGLTGLPRTLMLCGTRDTLYPQCRDLAARAQTAGWDLTYVEEQDLLHVYPILPLPEAKRALADIVVFLGP